MMTALPFRGVCTTMTRPARILAGAGAAAALMASPAYAASEVDAGGYLNQALQAAHADLVGGGMGTAERSPLGNITISVGPAGSSTVTSFTPRFGGLSIGQGQTVRDYGSLLKSRLALEDDPRPERRGLRIGPGESAEIGGLEIDWSAIAELEDGALGSQAGTFSVGGEMAISGLHIDATVGQGSGPLGLEGNRMSAGLGYDFGSVNTRVSYSLVENEDEMTEASLFSLGSQLTLNPGLVLEGDLAYADEQGDVTTAGRLSVRFNF